MNMQEIRQLAKEKGAKIGTMNKVDAIRLIQLTEGNISCFAKEGAANCPQGDCLFRADCVKLAEKATH